MLRLLLLLCCATLVMAAEAKAPWETETWANARQLVWANPGTDGTFKDAVNWLEKGKPATKGPDQDTDIVLPAADKEYKVQAARCAVRHVTIEKNAFLIGGHRSECEAWGNVWVKPGGFVYYISILGPQHSFFRIDDAEFPNEQNKEEYRHTSARSDKINRTQISHKFQLCKYGDASCEFIGKFGVSDEIMIQHGRLILNGELRWSGVTNKGALEIYDGGILELRSGAAIGPFTGKNNKNVFNIDVYRGGILQAGSPERPLTENAYVLLGADGDDKPGSTGLYTAVGSQVRVFSSDPTKHRLVFDSIASRGWSDGKGRALEKNGPGITMELAGDLLFDGVQFNQVMNGGIHLLDPTSTKQWKNVSFGATKASKPENLISKLRIDPNIYYHQRGDAASEYGLTTTAVKSMDEYMKRIDPYKLTMTPDAIDIIDEKGLKKPIAKIFPSAVNVSLACELKATIYYTTDGSDPTESSTPYKQEISLSKTTTIKARAYVKGKEPSAIIAGHYVIGALTGTR